MRSYRLPAEIEALIFDMDNTLYTNAAYARHQEAVLVERLAAERGMAPADCQAEIDAWRAAFAAAHDGKKPSLGNTFVAFGAPIETSVAWRNELIRPERYLAADPALAAALAALGRRFRLAVVTNNPVALARRTLAVLGVAELLPIVVGLDSTNVSKPDPAAFALAARSLETAPRRIVSVGDRYEVDLEPALALGMGGILVAGVADVVSLPAFFGLEKI